MARKARKGRRRSAWRDALSQSKLSLTQLISTALAAITMAVVSSRLTSFSSSILIVGLISMVSAVSSEFYRILVTASAEKTKQVVAPILGEGHAGEHGAHSGAAASDAGEAKTLVEGDLTTTQVATAAPQAVVVESDAPDSDEGDSTDTQSEESPSTAKRLFQALLHNQVVQMSFVFLVVALITVGVSYVVARAQGGDEFHTYTTVQQSLSEEEKQALLDEASAKAKTEGETTPGQTNTDPLNAAEQDLNADETLPDADLEQLRQENADLKASIANLQAALEAGNAQMENMMARLNALEQQLAEQGPAPAPTPTE